MVVGLHVGPPHIPSWDCRQPTWNQKHRDTGPVHMHAMLTLAGSSGMLCLLLSHLSHMFSGHMRQGIAGVSTGLAGRCHRGRRRQSRVWPDPIAGVLTPATKRPPHMDGVCHALLLLVRTACRLEHLPSAQHHTLCVLGLFSASL